MRKVQRWVQDREDWSFYLLSPQNRRVTDAHTKTQKFTVRAFSPGYTGCRKDIFYILRYLLMQLDEYGAEVILGCGSLWLSPGTYGLCPSSTYIQKHIYLSLLVNIIT
ncbi:hypothetical protein AMECASPLE_037411 [Ameca splendens]|uniref:Uncharacterized protein n=1 Tax=Ameca splendens TaxID=208324 RepID=A0ABV1AFJ6_9TELE